MKVATTLLARVLVASALAAGCDPEPFTLIVGVRDTAVVAYRDGDGEWTPVEPGQSGKAGLRITSGRYSLAWICESPRAAFVLHSTTADEPQAHCSRTRDVVTQLRGTTSPNATVFVADREMPTSELGSYAVLVPSGYHDVVAISADVPPLVMIQRDVDLRANRELDLPVAEQGIELASVQPSVTGAPQTIALTTELRTRHGDRVVLPSGGEVVPVLPQSLLVDTDWQVVRAVGEQCSSQVRVGSGTPQIEIPDPPVSIVERTRLRWFSELDWRYVQLRLVGPRGEYTISVTRDWMEQADADGMEIPDLSLLPGFTSDLVHLNGGDSVAWSVYSERGDRSSALAACVVSDVMTW